MTNPEKLHQAYRLLSHNRHDKRGEELYREVELSHLKTPNDLQVFGYLALEFGDIHEAVKALKQSVKKDKKDAQTFLLLGISHRRLKEYAPAIAAFRESLKIAPETIDTIYNLGITLDDYQQYESAIDILEKGLEIAPKDTDLLNAIAGASASGGYTEDAEEYYRQAIAIEPNFAPFQYNLSQVLLQIEEWEEGWKLFDSRLAFRNQALNPTTDAPFWKGEDLTDKSILVWNEQGFGDTLQFMAYVVLLQQKAREVVLRAQPGLKQLIELNFEGLQIIEPTAEMPLTDFQIPIMSLPQYFGNKIQTLPFPVTKYSNIDSPIAPSPLLKIGLVWAGNPYHPDDQKRSIPPRFFTRLLKLKNIEWYSLQVGESAEALQHPKLIQLAPFIEDFADTAALIEDLDWVISVDTAVAHLAGVMHKKVWLLLDYAPDWRWGLEGESTDWYASMRIFRQQKAGGWNGVMMEVLKALRIS